MSIFWHLRSGLTEHRLLCGSGTARPRGLRACGEMLGVALIVIVTGVSLLYSRDSHSEETVAAQYLNAAAGVAYVGSQACAGCHPGLSEEYQHTSMARSLTLPIIEPEKVPVPATVFDQKLNQYFQVFRQGNDLYQSIYAVDHERELFRHTEKLAYVMGTGENGMCYLIRRGDFLFQAPLAFYTRPRSWELAPWEGGEYPLGFARPITAECIVCHSGLPQPVANRVGLYKEPPFREMGIGCENCHGPGQLHVASRLRGDAIPHAADPTIVNPARLPAWLANDICLFCHQEGAATVTQPGKTFLDFRPGTPLDNTVAVFKLPLKREQASSSLRLLDHYSQLKLSKCYRQSKGQLRCLTCHNPHRQPSAAEAVAYYRKSCLQCHTEQNCQLPLEKRAHENPPDDCAGCHMRKRHAEHIAHSAVTDHRIVARPDEPYPELAFQQTTPELPDLVHLNVVPGKESSPISPLVLLQAYAQVLSDNPGSLDPVYVERYSALVERAAKSNQDNVFVQRQLARRAAKEGTPQGTERAVAYLQRAVDLGSPYAEDHVLLAQLLARSGRPAEAVEVLQQAFLLNPYDPTLYVSLAMQYLRLGRKAEALTTARRGLQLFPENSFLRTLENKITAGD